MDMLKNLVFVNQVRSAIEGQINPPSTPAADEKRLEMLDSDTDNEGPNLGRFSINRVPDDRRGSDTDA